MKMRLRDGKTKVLTLSYDDGVVQDARLIEIMNKYGIKGTFNINSGRFLSEDSSRTVIKGNLKLSEAKELYLNSPHEIAVHSLTHPFLDKLDTAEVIYEITEDRKSLENNFGKLVRGMAYPYGTYNNTVIDILDKCQIAYARTTKDTHKFKLPENWLELHPTCHHNYTGLEDLTKKFVNEPSWLGNIEMFYLWGHSYEFDNDNNWNVIEDFVKLVGGHEHIWYATNIEIYDYVKAYGNLQSSYDKKIIYNPSNTELWFENFGETYHIKPGETLKL